MSTWDDARCAIQDELELGNLCSTHEKEQADAAMRAIQSVGGAVIAEAGWAIEDPDPQPPEPTLREQVARMLYSAENPTFKWDSVPSQWHHRRMFDMADTIIGNFDITPKAPRP